MHLLSQSNINYNRFFPTLVERNSKLKKHPEWLPEDSPQRRFATEDSPHTQRVRHTNVTKNLSISVGQTCATVPMWKIRHTTVIGWCRGFRSGGLGLGGLSLGVGPGS